MRALISCRPTNWHWGNIIIVEMSDKILLRGRLHVPIGKGLGDGNSSNLTVLFINFLNCLRTIFSNMLHQFFSTPNCLFLQDHHHHHRSAAEQATTSFLQPQRSCANSDSLPGPIMLSVSPKRCWMYLRNRVRCLPGFLFPSHVVQDIYFKEHWILLRNLEMTQTFP